MAMTMKGEVDLPASREIVWQALNDPEVLKSCIPGCQSLERTGGNTLLASAKVKVGPVSAAFKGKVNLIDLDPPNGYRIVGEGDGGVAGFAKGGATVRLAPIPIGTKLTYDVEAQVGGKLAQLGARLIDGVAKKMADQFFADFAAAVEKQAGIAAPEPAVEQAQQTAGKGLLQRLTAWVVDLWRQCTGSKA